MVTRSALTPCLIMPLANTNHRAVHLVSTLVASLSLLCLLFHLCASLAVGDCRLDGCRTPRHIWCESRVA
jgi:hypothetical protein